LVGPSLDQLRLELGRPMADLEEPDPKHLKALSAPPKLVEKTGGGGWGLGFLTLAWGIAFAGLGWTLRKGLPQLEAARYRELARKMVLPRVRVRLESPHLREWAAKKAAVPVVQPAVRKVEQRPAPAAVVPQEMGKNEIIRFKAMTEFTSWPELLQAARCGGRASRAVFDSGPEHPALQFRVSSDDFKRCLPLARNVHFSEKWVRHIVGLLQDSETFDEMLVVASPLGQRHAIPMTAGVTMLNTVLGYETLAPEIRQQLELRRWILMHTRQDGAEQTDVIAAFRARVAAAAVGGLMAPARGSNQSL
jgi:hypothetical protein